MRFDENPLTCQCQKEDRFDENPLTCQCQKEDRFDENPLTCQCPKEDRFDENLLTCQCQKEDQKKKKSKKKKKKHKGFRFGIFVGRFSDIMAVKGLMHHSFVKSKALSHKTCNRSRNHNSGRERKA